MLRNVGSSRFNSLSPPSLKTKKGASTGGIEGTPSNPGDRSELSGLDQRQAEAKPQTPKKTLLSIFGAAALLGLSGLGLFQGLAGGAQATVPVQPEVAVESVQTQAQAPEVLTQMEVSPQMMVAGRHGQLLNSGKILKFDQYPGLHTESLKENIPGAPNFRQVPGTDVYGVAQPTVDGLRNVLDRVGGKEHKVMWTNMREEPVVYINGRSFSLREEAHPFENADQFKGASAESVDRNERQLKADILAEAKANGGRVLIHEETADGSVVTEWVQVTPESVRTTAETYQDLQAEGYQVDYARVPVTDEKTPEYQDLQALVDRLKGVEAGTPEIFNCHAGRGRTTTGMVAAQLLQRAEHGESTDPFQRVDTVHQDIREQGNYDMGNYRLILSLIKKLDHGVQAKAETDQVLDQTQDIQNLRTDINRYREKSLKAGDASSAQRAESRGLDYLHRYHTLITFNEYLKEQAPKGFEQTFEQWIQQHPDVTKMLDSFELAMRTGPAAGGGAQYA